MNITDIYLDQRWRTIQEQIRAMAIYVDSPRAHELYMSDLVILLIRYNYKDKYIVIKSRDYYHGIRRDPVTMYDQINEIIENNGRVLVIDYNNLNKTAKKRYDENYKQFFSRL